MPPVRPTRATEPTGEPDGHLPGRLRAALRALGGDAQRRRKGAAELGLASGRRAVLAEGPHLLAEAVAAGMPVRLVVGTERGLTAAALAVDQLGRTGVPVYRAREGEFAHLAATRSPQGILAVVELRAPRDAVGLADAWRAPGGLVVGLCGVQDPGNVGSLARTALAAGAAALTVDARVARDDDPKTLRASQGALFRLSLCRLEAADALALARGRGARTAAAVPRRGAAPWQVDLTGPLLLLLGGEGGGLDDAVAAAADVRLTLPMAAGESLGVAAAGAALLYERVRQASR